MMQILSFYPPFTFYSLLTYRISNPLNISAMAMPPHQLLWGCIQSVRPDTMRMVDANTRIIIPQILSTMLVF